jgi:hypothetical protein
LTIDPLDVPALTGKAINPKDEITLYYKGVALGNLGNSSGGYIVP